MKIIFFIFAIIALSSSEPVEKKEKLYDKVRKDLLDYYNEFEDLIEKIYISYHSSAAVIYIINVHYEEFDDARKFSCSTSEASKVLEFFDNLGITLKYYCKDSYFTLEKNAQAPTVEEKEKLENLMNDLNAITDLQKIKEFQAKKLESSPAFKEFYDAIQSEEAQDLFKNLLANPQVDNFFKTLEKYGIPMLDYQLFLFKIRFMML